MTVTSCQSTGHIESCVKFSWSVKNREILDALFLVICQNTSVVKLAPLSNSLSLHGVVYAPCLCIWLVVWYNFFKKNIYLFIYLVAPGLSCGRWAP